MSSLLTCLEARRLHEVAQIWGDEEMQIQAEHTAFDAGRLDCQLDVSFLEVPPLFRTTPFLLGSWKEGWQLECESEDMAHCDGCHDSHGDLCPYHG